VTSRLRSAMVCIALIGLALGTLGAGDRETRFDKLGHNLMCVCGCNEILLECNHVGCPDSQQMREKLSILIAGGNSDEQVFDGFVKEYGDIVRAAPPAKGFGRVAWITPFVILFAGLLGASVIAKRWSADERFSEKAGTGMSDAALDAFRRKARQETEL